jgi:hypothetical protein
VRAAVQSEGQTVQQRIWQEEASLQHLEDTRTKLDKQLVMDFGPEVGACCRCGRCWPVVQSGRVVLDAGLPPGSPPQSPTRHKWPAL